MAVVATGTRDIRDSRSAQAVFTITNYTDDVAMDCNAASDAEICDVLATLIKQLIEAGIINGTVATA